MTWRDIAALFEKMELDLIKSLKRNLGDHKAWEKEEGFDWPAWQAEKLKHIKRYREQNEEIMKEYRNQISEETEKMLQEQYAEGYRDESDFFDTVEQAEDGTWQLKEADREPDEVLDTEEIKKTPTEDSFFGINDNRLNKLIEDMQTIETKVESAALRMMDDVYRQTLYKAEIAMAAGATTLPQALDMATKDFLNAGINCIEYKDGRRVNIDDYAQMALRTAATKAYMQGEARKRDEMGVDTILISQYGACSETCLPWQGRVYIDDVWGSVETGSDESDWIVRKAKSLIHGGNIISFEQLPDGLKNSFVDGLKMADNNTGRLLYKLYKEEDYELTSGADSLYRRDARVISLNEKATPATIAHELFHRADSKYKISKNSDFETLLKSDYTTLKKVSSGNVKRYLQKIYPDAFKTNERGTIVLKSEYRGIADILNAFGEKLGYGHSEEYWNKPQSLSREAWAQFGRIKYANSDLVCRMLEELFPSFEKGARMALEKVLKRG